MQSRERPRRARPRRRLEPRPPEARRARPMTAPARPAAVRAQLPGDPRPAEHRRALPTTGAVRRAARQGRPVRLPMKAPQAAALPPGAAEAEQRQGVAEAEPPSAEREVVPPAAAPRARPRLEQERQTAALRPAKPAAGVRPARPNSATVLRRVARPTSLWESLRAIPTAAPPMTARAGLSPTWVARRERARLRPADPSSGRGTVAAGPGRPSRRRIPVAERRLAEPTSAPQAAAQRVDSRSRCATGTPAGLRSCSFCPWFGCGGLEGRGCPRTGPRRPGLFLRSRSTSGGGPPYSVNR